MNKNNIYYVYAYKRLDNNTYFYIGKGKDDRYKRKSGRNNHFLNMLNKVDYTIEFLYENLSEDEAFELESSTIHDLVFNEGYGIDITGYNKKSKKHLVNCTWGGEGSSGFTFKQSEECIAKRVAKNKGQKRNKEQKERMRQSAIERNKKYPELIDKLKTCRIGYKESDEVKKKLSKMRKGVKQTPEHIQAVKNGKEKMTKEDIEKWKYNLSFSTGTHIRCIELDREFSSLNKSVEYMKKVYDIPFNKHSLSKHLKGEKEWYGIIEINGVQTKLHWEYV